MDTFIYSWLILSTFSALYFRGQPFKVLMIVGASCFLNYALLDADIPAVRERNVAFALSIMFFGNIVLALFTFTTAWLSYKATKRPEGFFDLSESDEKDEIIRAPEPEKVKKRRLPNLKRNQKLNLEKRTKL